VSLIPEPKLDDPSKLKRSRSGRELVDIPFSMPRMDLVICHSRQLNSSVLNWWSDDFWVAGAVKGSEICNIQCVEATSFGFPRRDQMQVIVNGSAAHPTGRSSL
jgi:hypothetical protein